MTTAFIAYDAAARDRIAESLDETLFVEAGAGTGKTTSLVRRILALISTGRTTLDRIAAITFTDAAAAELRERVRELLERAVSSPDTTEMVRGVYVRALTDLDQAALQTLHSFAARLLRERPLEAGLPPGFEMLDALQAGLLFDEAWEEWLDGALDDPALTPILRRAFSMGVTLDQLRRLALAFHEHTDLLADAEFPSPDAADGTDVAAALIAAVPGLERLCSYARNGESDPLVAHVRTVQATARRLASLGSDMDGFWRVLASSPNIRTTRGNQKDWQLADGENACTTLKNLLAGLDRIVQTDLKAQRQVVLAGVAEALRAFVLDYAAVRRRQGRVEFNDLLVWTRDLLRDRPDIRDHFRGRFTHLLIDEAQDTDPLQAEIALFLAEDATPETPPELRPRSWLDVTATPGKLFVVGDPKQSIYRFRRADVALTLRFRQLLATEPVALVQNFRSQRPVVTWVNHVFGRWMMEVSGQVAYTPLVHRWEALSNHPVRPGVHQLGDALDDAASIAEVREREAAGVAALLHRIRNEGWLVLDSDASQQQGQEVYRPARARDICMLTPRRTGLPAVLQALEDADISYRLESASLIFATQEVRDLLNALRTIDDPTDAVALVATLRSPAFACSDADLFAFVEAGGRLDYLAPLPAAMEGQVAGALTALRDYHKQSRWASPAMLLERFLRERRLLELALAHRRPRELWRRYHWLLEAVRAFAEAEDGHIRAFLAWAEQQADEDVKVVESPMPETDEDAVRIMTIHAAKGLEFPVVVLVGLNQTSSGPTGRLALFDRQTNRIEVRLGLANAGFETDGYAAALKAEQQLDAHEAVRLLYVAATRARDHLAVSVYRSASDKKSAAAQIATHLADATDLWTPIAPGVPSAVTAPAAVATVVMSEDTPDVRAQWQVERSRMLRDRARPPAVAATTLARVVKEATESVDQPWRRGRGGAPLGRAVHAVLQTVDLATGAGLEELARGQALGEGIPDREHELVRLVRGALESTVVRRAVTSGRMLREALVAAPAGGGVVEGFIDLLFEEPDGLVIVDYKTDALDTEEQVAQAMERYRLQAGAYALALQGATGKPVKEVVFLFLRPSQEVSMTDIATLIAEAEVAAREVLGGD